MVIAKTIGKARGIIANAKRRGKMIGFVPTMGALHKGHLSLVRKTRRECSYLVVSIFVNSLQFGPVEDFKRYPRNFKKDKELLQKAGVDLIFYPRAHIMYPSNASIFVNESVLSRTLCGKSRPGHFRGVCTVVSKLFNIIRPDIAYFGQKDYQQALIISKLVRDLNFPIKIKILPTIREKSGLAMSSRNQYLRKTERETALCPYEALLLAKSLIKKGQRHPQNIISKMRKVFKNKKSAKIDYIEILDADNLKKANKIEGKVLIALAVYIGKTRLIDNIILKI